MVRSRWSSNATWPGVWPGVAITSSEPTRSGLDGTVGLGLGARVAAAELVLRLARIETHVLGQKPGIAGRDDHFCLRKSLLQRVERADVVGVGVGEEDADDWRTDRLGPRDDLAGRAPDHRVDHGQPVLLAHQVRIHESQPADPIHISHRSVRVTDVPPSPSRAEASTAAEILSSPIRVQASASVVKAEMVGMDEAR